MADDRNRPGLGTSLGEIIEHLTTLIHEEIELAKAEFSVALQNLIRGSVAGVLGGVFAFFATIVLLIGLAFFINDAAGWEGAIWPGFFIVALGGFLIGGIAAWFALKKIKKGSHIAPSQAIYEAKKTSDALKNADEVPLMYEAEGVVEETETVTRIVDVPATEPKTEEEAAKDSAKEEPK